MIASEQLCTSLGEEQCEFKFHELNDFNTQVDITLPSPRWHGL